MMISISHVTLLSLISHGLVTDRVLSMADTSRRPIPPNPERWKPAEDPSTIVIPGLDTDASTTDQIEQIEQLITIKLQVRTWNFITYNTASLTKI